MKTEPYYSRTWAELVFFLVLLTFQSADRTLQFLDHGRLTDLTLAVLGGAGAVFLVLQVWRKLTQRRTDGPRMNIGKSFE